MNGTQQQPDEGFVDETTGVWVRGLYDYVGNDASALSFQKGAIIEVFNQLETGWWDGVLDDERGWFPSNYVQVLTPAETEVHLATLYAREQAQANAWDTDESNWGHTNGHTRNISRTNNPRPQSLADDFWMPQVSGDGQIYYMNSKTGETSRDMPAGSSSVVDSAIELNEPQPQQNGYPNAYDILRTRTSSSARASEEVPSTWVKRLADDGISHYWYNTATGEAQWHEPSINGPTASTKITSPDEYEDEDAGYQALRKGFSNDVFTHSEMSEDILRRLSVYSDVSETQSPSNPTNITYFLSNTRHNSAFQSAASLQLNPEALAERNAKDLQFHLAPRASETFSDLSVVVQRAINEIIDANPSPGGNDPAEAALVMERVAAVVIAVRTLLYTSGTLAAPISSLLPQTAEAAESSRSPMIELRPYQRKVTATLSKLVLSARATKSNMGTRTGSSPVFDARVDLDAAELDRAIMVLVSEIQRASAYGRAKRLHAVFDSPDGVGGVGLGNPGGGVGGHMKALGFVPGDDVIERLALGRNLVEDLDGFRTKVEDCLKPLENENTAQLQDQGPLAVTELSALLAFVEDIDVASYLDVTGSRGNGDDHASDAAKAQSLLRQLEWSKQAIFDEGMLLLMLCQGERDTHPFRSAASLESSEPETRHALAKAALLARSLRAHITGIQSVLDRLIGIAERQAVSRQITSAARQGRGIAQAVRGEFPFPVGNHSSDALNGFERPQRDSTILPSMRVVDRPDSPLRVAEDTQAAAAQLQSMAMDIPQSASSSGEFVDMEDAFSAPRPPPPQATAAVNTMSEKERKISRERLTPAVASAASMVAASQPPFHRTRERTPDSDEEDDVKLTQKSPPRRGASNKLYKLLGEDIPAEKPWYLQAGYSQKELLLTPDGEVRGGTLESLVERLTYHYAADTAFNEAFLITFKSFTTPAELIDLLAARFEKEPPDGLDEDETLDWKRNWQDPVRGRVINSMRRLLVEDDCITSDDKEALEKMKAFVAKHEPTYPGVKMVAGTLQTLMSTGSAPTRKLSKTVPVGAPSPLVPRQNPSRKIKFLDIDPTEVARQLTLMESELFSKIRGTECLARAEGGQMENDNIKAVISMSNKIADWVNEAVLAKEDPRKRSLLIKHFILITDKCRQINNFSTMAALVAALNSPPIRRLKRSWDQINTRHISMLDDIETLMQAGKSLPDYRAMLSKVTLPCIPFIGVYLTSLTFIQDGMKDILAKEGGLINFLKRSKASAIITEIKKYQSSPYNYFPVEAIRSFLENALKVDRPPDFYWELSLQREPRERDDEKMARLLQESGFL